jgi:hypothetical protein
MCRDTAGKEAGRGSNSICIQLKPHENLQKVYKIFCGFNYWIYFCGIINKDTTMINNFFNPRWMHGFDLDQWLKIHKPKISYDVNFWEDIVIEHEEIVEEFRTLLNSKEQVFDKDGNPLTPLNLYNLINEYQIRLDKLALIFNLRLYKTLNENKKTGVKYIVMRAFWIDEKGKNVRWFSRNLGAEGKVLVNGKIPVNQMEAIEKEMLLLMWDQYVIDYWDNGYLTGIDSDGNHVIVDD